jgi:hypothetical protein
MDNAEILTALREIQTGVADINTRAAGPLPIPPELLPGATVSPEARAKALDAYTSKVYDLPSKQWSKEQAALIKEQIQTVLAGL